MADHDTLLLREFTRGSDEAFAQLVRRHAHWVLAVARRRVRDADLAEDVAQAAFIVLARKAHQLNERTALPAWLFHVTRLAASRALRDDSRRRRRETEAFMRRQRERGDDPEETSDPTWREVEPYLDDSVARLRASDREAVLLRFYQRKTFGEVAAAIGATEDAARKRVSRALEKLRALLVRRGATVPAVAALSSAMWAHATQAAAPALVASIATGAVCTTGLINNAGAALALAKGAIHMITLNKAKNVAAAAVVLLFTGLLGVALIAQARAQGHGSKPQDNAPHAPRPAQVAAPSTAPADPADAHAAAAARMKVTQVVPILQVADVPASMSYYEEKLGFETLWTHGDDQFAAIGRDGMMIFLQCEHGEVRPSTVYMVVSDVDALHADAAARGAEIVHAPEDRPWGMREMIVKDLDENVLRVGTMRGHAEEPVKPKR